MTFALRGRPQTAEHVRRRVAATAAERATWSLEKESLWRSRVSANNAAGRPEIRARNAAAHIGKTPWNKGNRWQDKLTPDEVRAIAAARARARRAKNPKRKVHERMSARIWHALRGKGGRGWESLVGYTTDQLMRRLHQTMPSGYGWDDFLAGKLEIDHIIPVAAFNFTAPGDIDFGRCWALSNLRLLPALENMKKGATLTAPFQPALAFGLGA